MKQLLEQGRLYPLAIEEFEVSLVENMQPRVNNGVNYLDTLVDARLCRRILLYVVSTCNQALTVQAVGHTRNQARDANGLSNIGGSLTLAVNNGVVTIGFDLDTGDWMPFLGVTVTAGAAAPTAGLVRVFAFGERLVKIPREALCVQNGLPL